MKKLFSIVMILLFLLIISQQGLVILHFKLNQEAIEQKFCENKTKPELACHGKCHLQKELQKTEKSDSESMIIFKNIEMILNSNYEFTVKTFKSTKTNKTLTHNNLPYSNPNLKIFIPPPDFRLNSRVA